MISTRAIATAWNRFFFEPVSVLPVCVYRIALGLTLLADAALTAPYITDLFGPDGVLSMEGTRHLVHGDGIDVLKLFPQTDGTTIGFFVVYAAAIVALTVGFQTRVAAGLAYVGIATLHHRNPAVLNGCDAFLRLMPLFLALSPAGEALSVDAWLRRRRGDPARTVAAPWAQRMMQIQLSILYGVTVLLKLHGAKWVDGTALYYILRIPEFQRFPVPYLAEHLWAIRAATWGTLVVELSLAVLVWVEEWRLPVLIAGLLLHLGIEYAMNLPLMEWVNIGAFALFLKPEEIERGLAFVRRRRRRGATLVSGGGGAPTSTEKTSRESPVALKSD